jgi:hypothetical protein
MSMAVNGKKRGEGTRRGRGGEKRSVGLFRKRADSSGKRAEDMTRNGTELAHRSRRRGGDAKGTRRGREIYQNEVIHKDLEERSREIKRDQESSREFVSHAVEDADRS